MAAQKGASLLLKVGNGGSPESFTTIGGLRSTSITLNDEAVDVTNKDSSGNRELLADGGIHSMSISGSGVFTDAASETTLKGTMNASSFTNFQLIIPDFGTPEYWRKEIADLQDQLEQIKNAPQSFGNM